MDKELVERLKNNRSKYDLLDKEERNTFEQVGKENCIYHQSGVGWTTPNNFDVFAEASTYRIKPEYQYKEEPQTFTTLDGVVIRIGIDKCYAIDIEEKKFIYNGDRNYCVGDGINYAYFADKTKAECYLALLKGEEVEIYKENIKMWIGCIYSKPDYYCWDIDIFRIKPKQQPIPADYPLIDFTKIHRICIVDYTNKETPRCFDKTFEKVTFDVQDNDTTLKLICGNSLLEDVKESCLNQFNNMIKEQENLPSEFNQIVNDNFDKLLDDNLEYKPYSEPNPDLKGKWVKHKDSGFEWCIIGFSNKEEKYTYVIKDIYISNKELFEDFTFLDGSVIGQVKK